MKSQTDIMFNNFGHKNIKIIVQIRYARFLNDI